MSLRSMSRGQQWLLGVSASHHDTAAVLLRNGEVVAAIEEERLNRVKHTNAFPRGAIHFCLSKAAIAIHDVDAICINVSKESLQRAITEQASSQRVPFALTPELHMLQRFRSAGFDVIPEMFRFVPHHVAHAASAYFQSGFDSALVLSIDGVGDDSVLDTASGVVFSAHDADMARLRTLSRYESLGFLYGQITKLLGFREFDEYKVMGLAAFGDRGVYGERFQECCTFLPDGGYSINRPALLSEVLQILATAPTSDGKGNTVRENIAAACQSVLEGVVLHMLEHYQKLTGNDRLAMAGGVALNCALNARILCSGLFKQMFVQPASHDAGGALGAALLIAHRECPTIKRRPQITHVFWGTDISGPIELKSVFERWAEYITWSRPDNLYSVVARRLSEGAVIGWVQSRSEFGPRALGNRSILADPRPVSNRDRVNRMIKQREGFRPFAPSVLRERLLTYFEVPDGCHSLPFMNVTVTVRESERANLRAITHVDGTARVQTVSKECNARYWTLIREFGEITGICVLLNTSFNNSAEPIVDSVEDAICAFLTMELDLLVIGDFLIDRRQFDETLLLRSIVTVSGCTEFGRTGTESGVDTWIRYRFEPGLAIREPITIARETFNLLCNCDGSRQVGEILKHADGDGDLVLRELLRLWWLRLIRVQPAPDGVDRCHQ